MLSIKDTWKIANRFLHIITRDRLKHDEQRCASFDVMEKRVQAVAKQLKWVKLRPNNNTYLQGLVFQLELIHLSDIHYLGIGHLEPLHRLANAIRWADRKYDLSWTNHILSFTTEPVILERLTFGQFRVHWTLTPDIQFVEGPTLRVDPVTPFFVSGYCHPHISSGHLCLGHADAMDSPLQQSITYLNAGHIAECFMLINACIHAHNPLSTYQELSIWHDAKECDYCGEMDHPDTMFFCVVCQDHHCSQCRPGGADLCVYCGSSVCSESCADTCHYCRQSNCQKELCPECSWICSDCNNHLCPDHIYKIGSDRFCRICLIERLSS